MQRSTEAQGQTGKTPKPRWRNRALTLAPLRAVTGEPLARGPGMTPITVSQRERLLSITLQTEGRYCLQGSETHYRMPKRSIWGLYKIYYGYLGEEPKAGRGMVQGGLGGTSLGK